VTVTGLSTDPRRWLRHALEDLAVAERLLGHSEATPRHVCMSAQQAAEKALGAILVFLGMNVPLSQRLETVRDAIPADWRLRAEPPDLANLSRWSAEEQDARSWIDPTDADAQHAIRQARAVWESVLRDLEQHGFDVAEYR
jgi:HEPN domain-containing protein